MKKYIPILLLLPLLLVSCGLNNTMYNARKYFKAAQARPLNANGRPTNQAIEEYTKAIKKCGIILSEKKTTRQTDEALFIMAQALYLKGNSAFQAKDQFENLIKSFPESPHFGEAHILLAKVLKDINRKAEGVKLLEDFVRNPEQKKMHPRALLTLTDVSIADKDYAKAQYWLDKIITEYPKSDEYREAFFLFGKNYYVQGDYAASLREFEKLAGLRSIPEYLRLDARYYVALNQFLLQLLDESWKTLQKLEVDEDRPDKIAQLRVLKGRLLIARGKGDEGLAELDAVSKTYMRTAPSAEAQYFTGEYNFYALHNLDTAQAAYNRVKAELPTSEYFEDAQKKYTALTQLKQIIIFDPNVNVQPYLDYQIAGAENYLNNFALPDSALMMYQRIIDTREVLLVNRDSLGVLKNLQIDITDSLTIQIDSLTVLIQADSLAVSDTLQVQTTVQENEIITPETSLGDSLQTDIAELETGVITPETAVSDSIRTDIAELESEEAKEDFTLTQDEIPAESIAAVADTIAVITTDELLDSDDPALLEKQLGEEVKLPEPTVAVSDSLTKPETQPTADLAERKRNLEQQLTVATNDLKTLNDKLSALNDLIARYDREIIPLSLFSQASIISKTTQDSLRIADLDLKMQTEYPDNKYTKALDALRAGEPVRLIDPLELSQEAQLEAALGMAETQPDSMLIMLQTLKDSAYSDIRLKTNFRLGWFYTFEQPDTTSAKAYLDEVLKVSSTSDYTTLASRFYDGKNFKFRTDLSFPDSLRLWDLPDTLGIVPDSTAMSDSLALSDSTAVSDSLNSPEETAAPPLEETPPEIGAENKDELTPQETPERKEETPSEVVPPPNADGVDLVPETLPGDDHSE